MSWITYDCNNHSSTPWSPYLSQRGRDEKFIVLPKLTKHKNRKCNDHTEYLCPDQTRHEGLLGLYEAGGPILLQNRPTNTGTMRPLLLVLCLALSLSLNILDTKQTKTEAKTKTKAKVETKTQAKGRIFEGEDPEVQVFVVFVVTLAAATLGNLLLPADPDPAATEAPTFTLTSCRCGVERVGFRIVGGTAVNPVSYKISTYI